MSAAMRIEFVRPGDVEALRARVGPELVGAAAALGGAGEDLAREWHAYSARPATWATAPAELEAGRDFEARLAWLRRGAPRVGQAASSPATTTTPAASSPAQTPASSPPATSSPTVEPTILGLVTPGDVLAYRKTWEPYIKGAIDACEACADLWRQAAAALAATPPAALPPGVNVSQFAARPDVALLQVWADSQHENAEAIRFYWNLHANTDNVTLIVNAASILGDHQHAVLKVGQVYLPSVRRDCPAIPVPDPPTLDVQSQVIGRLEGLGVVAKGALQLLGIGVGGALDTLGTVGHIVKRAAETVTSPTPWIALGLVGALGLVLAVGRR